MGRLNGQVQRRPDQKLFLSREFANAAARLSGAVSLARGLAQVARGEAGQRKEEPSPAAAAARRAPPPAVFRSKRR
jgi:hypothetical protein